MIYFSGRFGGKEGIFPACFVPAIPDHWNIPEDSETFTENFGKFQVPTLDEPRYFPVFHEL